MQAPFSDSSTDVVTVRKAKPAQRNWELVASDEFTDGPFRYPGKVMTSVRPTDENDLPMYAEGEPVSEEVLETSPIVLPAPWENRWWFGEIRSTYMSSIRYYNGWVPWYGNRPNSTWWRAASLAAQIDVLVTYDPDMLNTAGVAVGGTEVNLLLTSHMAGKLHPNAKYHWDFESARPVEFDGEGHPVTFDMIKTWVQGEVIVGPEWTISTPVVRG